MTGRHELRVILAVLLLIDGVVAGARPASAVDPPPSEPPAQAPSGPGQSPGHPHSVTPETVTADTTMADVNGVKITFGQLDRMVREQIPNVTGHGTISPGRLRQRAFELLDQMVTDELILQEAARLQMAADQKQVEAELAKQRSRFSTEEDYRNALAQRQLTEQQFRRRMERAVLIQQVIDREVNEKVTVTDDDLAAYYREHLDKFKIPLQYRLRLLLVSVDPSATPDEWEQAKQRAEAYRSRALGGEDFAALARQYSGDADTKNKGGDTGMVHHGQLGLSDVEHAVEHLHPGQITEPVRTLYGYYIAKVEETRPARQQTYDELNKALFRQELLEARRRERYREWITTLRSRARITMVSPSSATP
ncbi:MAG TPA: peptidylprolyl isomerase [Nitrospiria bacterium]|nr:peptidylprolyl isomerase [Nitrospiria bacterium]